MEIQNECNNNPFDLLKTNLHSPDIKDIQDIFDVASKDSVGRPPSYKELFHKIIIDFYDFETAAWFKSELILNKFKVPEGRICHNSWAGNWIRFEFPR